MRLNYPDSATFYKVISGRYANKKVIDVQQVVPVIWLQETSYSHNNNQDTHNSDAICFPDPENEFIVENAYRLEGFYILAPMFGADSDEGWYKVESVGIHRDHLLKNSIDNVQLFLKKTSKLVVDNES
jgi:hypothetical protein